MADSFLHQLLTLPTVFAAQLSPDKRLVALMWRGVHEQIDVFCVPTDGSIPPFPLTHTRETTMLVNWTSDSAAVIVAEDHDGDERTRLFRVAIGQPEMMHPLTEDRPHYFLRGGDLSSNSNVLFYGANVDVASGEEIEPTWVYRHELTTGKRTPIAQPARPAWNVPKLNVQGTHLLYSRQDRHPGGRQIHLVDIYGHEDREILNFGDATKVSAKWFPDGERILVLSESRTGQPQQHRSLGVHHWPTGELRWLIDDAARNIEQAWVTPDGMIVVDEIRDARHSPTVLNPDTGVETAFPQLPGNLLPLGQAPDGEWIGLYSSSTTPNDLVRFNLGAQHPDDLTSLTQMWQHTDLNRSQLVAAEDFRWQSADGLPIQGWLYRAENNQRRAVIYVHGGPTAHSEDRLNSQIQFLCAQGFNVLDVNYRGSTGFSLAFREAIKEHGWGGREQSDIATGAQALINAGLADAGQVGVTGTSYGGYSSWHLITHEPPEVIAAAAPICGMTDLVVDYQTTRPDLRTYSEEMLGGSPAQVPERYHERSPINFVGGIRGRLLIVQGAQDPNVTPENVRQVVERLDAANIPYELLVFDDEGHGISKAPNQERLYQCLATFFGAALGQTPEPNEQLS